MLFATFGRVHKFKSNIFVGAGEFKILSLPPTSPFLCPQNVGDANQKSFLITSFWFYFLAENIRFLNLVSVITFYLLDLLEDYWRSSLQVRNKTLNWTHTEKADTGLNEWRQLLNVCAYEKMFATAIWNPFTVCFKHEEKRKVSL